MVPEKYSKQKWVDLLQRGVSTPKAKDFVWDNYVKIDSEGWNNPHANLSPEDPAVCIDVLDRLSKIPQVRTLLTSTQKPEILSYHAFINAPDWQEGVPDTRVVIHPLPFQRSTYNRVLESSADFTAGSRSLRINLHSTKETNHYTLDKAQFQNTPEQMILHELHHAQSPLFHLDDMVVRAQSILSVTMREKPEELTKVQEKLQLIHQHLRYQNEKAAVHFTNQVLGRYFKEPPRTHYQIAAREDLMSQPLRMLGEPMLDPHKQGVVFKDVGFDAGIHTPRNPWPKGPAPSQAAVAVLREVQEYLPEGFLAVTNTLAQASKRGVGAARVREAGD
jgi:hypothetical protein